MKTETMTWKKTEGEEGRAVAEQLPGASLSKALNPQTAAQRAAMQDHNSSQVCVCVCVAAISSRVLLLIGKYSQSSGVVIYIVGVISRN